jgi:hypothetical protein
MATRSNITTRAKNANQHPGLIVEKDKKKRRTNQEVQAERQAKEDAKQEKVLTRAAGIQCVAAYKQNQVTEDAVDATPKVTPQARQLHHTRSYRQIPEVEEDSDVEMGNMATDASALTAEYSDGDSDNDKTEPMLASPPRKKTRVEKKKAKPQVWAAIRAAQVMELEKGKAKGHKNTPAMMVDDGDEVLDLDPTPVKAKKTASHAAELDDDWDDQWAIPSRGSNDGHNVKAIPRGHGAEGKGKGDSKGKHKLEDKRVNTLKAQNSSDQKDVNRVPPKSKK